MTVSFIGSWYGPNLEAVRKIINFSKEMPEVNFLINGSACLAFHNEAVPTNIGLMGIVDDETKDIVLGIGDIAINLMEFGSDTNLKMPDYCLAGIPVISTTHGARRLGLRGDVYITDRRNR